MEHLTNLAYDWAVRCFGFQHVMDERVRALRAAEELIEVAQSLDVPKDQLHACIDMVYAKPKGELTQELGGAVLTLAVLCKRCGHDVESVFYRELNRVLGKSPEHFSKRNDIKIAAGMTGQ